MTALRIRAAFAGALALARLRPPSGALAPVGAPAPSAAPEEPSYLFVASAPSGSVDAETLTLRGVPAVTWFTDRPYRQ
ncbi:MAG: hypothetical protein ACKOTZ_01625, partial [Chloroflexota bacterium]